MHKKKRTTGQVAKEPCDADIRWAHRYHDTIKGMLSSMSQHQLQEVLADLGLGTMYHWIKHERALELDDAREINGQQLYSWLFPNSSSYPRAGSAQMIERLGNWAAEREVNQGNEESRSTRSRPRILPAMDERRIRHIDESCSNKWSLTKRMLRPGLQKSQGGRLVPFKRDEPSLTWP